MEFPKHSSRLVKNLNRVMEVWPEASHLYLMVVPRHTSVSVTGHNRSGNPVAQLHVTTKTTWDDHMSMGDWS